MGETSRFLSLTCVATTLASACILSIRSTATSKRIAPIFYFASAVMSFAALLWVLQDSVGMLPRAVESTKLFQTLIYRGWIVIGTGISSAILVLLGAGTRLQLRDGTRCFVTSPYLLRGLCLSVSISFICTEIGKVAHDADMRQFFIQSGYSVWFLYFIIVAEILGAVGLLFPKTLLPAAFGLVLIMAGAIRTHQHNRDPFSDSLEALHLLVLLACIFVVRLLAERVSEVKRTE